MNINEAAALLAEFLRAGEKATPGPWTFEQDPYDSEEYMGIDGPNGEAIVGGCGCCGSPYGDANSQANRALITLSRQVPDALRVVLRDAERLIAKVYHRSFWKDEQEGAESLLDAITPLLERGEEEDDG